MLLGCLDNTTEENIKYVYAILLLIFDSEITEQNSYVAVVSFLVPSKNTSKD